MGEELENEFKVRIRYRIIGEGERVTAILFNHEGEEGGKISSSKVISKSSEPSDRFFRLGHEWTRTAIRYFNVIPTLTSVGRFVGSEMITGHKHDELKMLASSSSESSNSKGERIVDYNFPIEAMTRVSQALAASRNMFESSETLSRASLVALVADYEAFVLELLTIVGDLRPEIFAGNINSLKFSDLAKYESIEDLRRAIISEKIDAILFDSHISVLNFLEERLAVNLTSDKELISRFVEVVQRRNIITHAGGVANNIYIEECARHAVSKDVVLKKGDPVKVTNKYLASATNRLFIVGFISLQIVWQKLLGDRATSDSACLQSSHDFLLEDLTKTARRIAQFPLSRKSSPPDFRTTAYLRINVAQSYLYEGYDWSSDIALEARKKFEEEISKGDWSTTGPIVDLVLAVLRDEFDDIEDLIRAAVTAKKESLSYHDFFTYNCFRRAIEDPRFSSALKKVFPEANTVTPLIAPPLSSKSKRVRKSSKQT